MSSHVRIKLRAVVAALVVLSMALVTEAGRRWGG